MPPVELTRIRRSHRLGACRTCRRRHVKCDQKRPSCRTCHSHGVPCEGFSHKIRWMHDDADTNLSTRHHLYTELSRSSMSSALGSRLISGSIDASLNEIDLRTRDADSTAADIVIGPFAVFKSAPSNSRQVQHVQSSGPESTENPGSISNYSSSLPSFLPPEPAILETPTYDSTPAMISSLDNIDDLLQWPDLLDCDFGQSTYLPSLRGGLDLQFDSNNAGIFDPPIGSQSVHCGSGPMLEGSARRSAGVGILPCHRSDDTTSTPLEEVSLIDAPRLFRNFNDKVIPLTMPIPLDEKSPWKILNVPSAMVTYGDLTILGSDKVSHARQANLYALLACSAHHLALDGSEDSPGSQEYLQGIVKQMAQRGLRHMQLSLQLETGEPKGAKYKDQLMAICCLTEYAILSANQEQARAFLIDAEYILRTRGLPKRRISQKARLLHHIYTWQRLLGESTYVLHDYTQSPSVIGTVNILLPRPLTDCLTSQSGPGPEEPVLQLDDFLRLQNHNASSDLNIDEPKSKQSGLRDIHLQDSRSFPDTLYKEVYGIPETWLSLLSQTTRLANVMETFRKDGSPQGSASDIWGTLLKRSGHLENMICLFYLRSTPQDGPAAVDSQRSQNPMLLALNAALVIFFYRRVRQVHPVILSSYVDSVISAFSDFDWTNSSGPATVWPIFIAGCEALTSSRRIAVLQLLQKAENINNFPCFKISKDIMTELWSQQDELLERNPSYPMPSWMDLIKHKKIWPLFC